MPPLTGTGAGGSPLDAGMDGPVKDVVVYRGERVAGRVVTGFLCGSHMSAFVPFGGAHLTAGAFAEMDGQPDNYIAAWHEDPVFGDGFGGP